MESDYLPLARFCKHHSLLQISDKLKKNINVRVKNGMYLYNYNQIVLVKRDHPVLVKCRGLVLDEVGNVLNYPMDRFFNYFEKEKCEIDWNSTIIQEKIDGSLICVFWNGEDWEITTRGSFYPIEHTDIDFALLFKKHFHHLEHLNKEFCYWFELVTKENRNITWYDEEFVVLLGAREIGNLKEVSQKNLDILAAFTEVKRPQTFPATNLTQCLNLFHQLKDDEEGLVVVDKYFNRLKVKQETYFQLFKIRMLKDQEILDYVRGLIELDSEMIQKDQNIVERIQNVKTQWEKYLDLVMKTFNELKDIDNRKEFALEAIKYPYRKLLFKLKDGEELGKISYEHIWSVQS